MASRDLFHRIAEGQSVAPAAHTANVTGTGVDLQDFESATVLVDAGTITDGTHTPKLQDSPDNSTFTDVPAASVMGAFTAMTSGGGNGSNAVQSVGYLGAQRYLRVFVTVASATTGGIYGATIVKGHPRHADTQTTQK